jgi:hypothetical protein
MICAFVTGPTSTLKAFLWSAAIVGVLLFSGCGPKGPKRYEHWGTVTFQDRPIPAGLVYFDPDGAGGSEGQDRPQGQAVIKDGKYDTRLRELSGPGSGKYVLRIMAFDGVQGPEAPIGRNLFAGQISIKVELPATDSELPLVIPPNTR